MPVLRHAASIGSMPRRSAAISAHRRWSFGVQRVARRPGSLRPRRVLPEQVLCRRPRASARPSCSAASKVRSMAITSPVAFICVPMTRSPQRRTCRTASAGSSRRSSRAPARTRPSSSASPRSGISSRRLADGDLGRHAGDRVAGRLRCQRRTSGDTRGLTSIT